jgi:hypothetical protein
MRYRAKALKFLAIGVLALAGGGVAETQKRPNQLITRCWQDVLGFDLGVGSTQLFAPGTDGISIRFDPDDGRFSLRRGTMTLFTFVVEDLSSDAEMLWSPDGKAFALNYSDGGAIGNFHVRVFSIQGDVVTETSQSIQPAVRDFKARHYCKARGNNVTALKWVQDSRRLLLMTGVYPTGDCGPDLGHTEGYVVAVPDGKIERRLTINQLKSFPGICLENDDGQ